MIGKVKTEGKDDFTLAMVRQCYILQVYPWDYGRKGMGESLRY